MKFNYTARTADGKVQAGSIEARSSENAVALLQKYNIFITSLKEEALPADSFLRKVAFTKKVSKKDLTVFFRQLSLMLVARVPVVQSLVSMVDQTKKPKFKKVLEEIASLVEEGIPLSEAFAAYPKVFNTFYVNIIKSGEASGRIAESLSYVADYVEKEADIVSQLKQVMVYPIFVISIFGVVMIAIVTFLVPKINGLIGQTGVQPPAFVVFILGFYKLLASYWWVLILLLITSAAFLTYYLNTGNGRKQYQRISLKIPVLKDFLKKVFLVRFCSNLSTLLSAGISINKSIQIAEDTISNDVYRSIVDEMEQRVSEGEKISVVMAGYPLYFPVFVVQMIRVGEETGKLDKVLMEIVTFYQKEIKSSVTIFSSLLEPIIIIALGLVAALLASSILFLLYGSLGTF